MSVLRRFPKMKGLLPSSPRLTDMESLLQEQKWSVLYKLPGFQLDDPDQTNFTAYDAMNFGYIFMVEYLFQSGGLYKALQSLGLTGFLKTAKVTIEPEFYSRTFQQDSTGFVSFPFVCDFKVEITKNDFLCDFEISDVSKLVRYYMILKPIDIKTQTPTSIPASLRLQLAGEKAHHDMSLFGDFDFGIPRESIISYNNVESSDIDILNHVAAHVYARWALESISNIITKSDSERLHVRTLRSKLIKQCFLGDVVKVETWREYDSSGDLYSLITKGSTLTTMVSVSLYPDTQSKL